MSYTTKDLDKEIEELQYKKKAIEAGEDLCDHHWNGSDNCYECYCTGCEQHIAEVRNKFDVPFKKNAYCYECKKTPEEKAEEKDKAAQALKARELKKLAELRGKYPDA
jgi:hypothetical protein